MSNQPPEDEEPEDEAAAIERAHQRLLEAREDPDRLLDPVEARKRLRELQETG